jgi:hypothetical protein
LAAILKKVKQSNTFSFQANYFTNLIDLGKWKIRQFIKPSARINRQNPQTKSVLMEIMVYKDSMVLYLEQIKWFLLSNATYAPKKTLQDLDSIL